MRQAARRRVRTPTQADRADRHELYQKAVQSPEIEIKFLAETYQALRGRKPHLLREDFCGTAYLATEWCKVSKHNHAIGVDIDEETLEWGREHNIEPAGRAVADRVTLHLADVREITDPKVDITAALNFSYCLFENRDELADYFRRTREGLKDDGLLVLDLFGGTEVYEEQLEKHPIDDTDVTYVWDQDSFNPIDHHLECRIHFEFPDGSTLEDAFSYSWRLWTMPEIIDLLHECGYRNVRVYWEQFEDPDDDDDDDDDDDELEGTGEYEEVTEVDNQESWMSYIVAEK